MSAPVRNASTNDALVDRFAQQRLPPPHQQPDFLFTLPGLDYPARLNCVAAFVDDHVAAGRGDRDCLIAGDGTVWTYADLKSRVDRIAAVLVDRYALVPGNRVLLRSANNPMMVAAYLAVIKAGGIVVATMPLLRAKELSYIVGKAEISLAICDARLLDEMERTLTQHPDLRVAIFGGSAEDERALEPMMTDAPDHFEAVDTAAEDICLIGFTSGTTGEPKGTMHNHRDMLAICDTYGRHVLCANADDRFIGSPPLAFTFGLGGLVLFPLRVGASTVLLEKAGAPDLLDAFRRLKPSVCFTAPTAYRAMLAAMQPGDTDSLRICVSAGEALVKSTFDAWKERTGLTLQDGIGATEMLHIFISAPLDAVRPGSTGKAVPGYEAKVIDAQGNEVPRGTIGRLAVRGPTGCRYLDDARQANYVENGWNVTGDTYRQDEDGYFWYEARSDDMIVSSGYNIAGPEVESSLLTHPAVLECGVVGAPDPERGQIVKAYIVLRPDIVPTPELAGALQEYVKHDIAPYKYPRAIEFVASLPRTGTGKLQRFQLRAIASSTDS